MPLNAQETKQSMDTIAKAVCRSPLPYSEMVERSLVSEFRAGVDVSQKTVATGVQGFAALTRVLMPSQSVGGYVKARCECGDILLDRDKTLPFHIVPATDSTTDEILPYKALPNVRANFVKKCTTTEAVECVNFMKHCPEVLFSLMSLQQMLGEYVADLRERIAKIDERSTDKLLEKFREHWQAASNFVSFFAMALHRVLPDATSPREVLSTINQTTMERAFDWLIESRSFEEHNQGRKQDTETINFTCPAQLFLRELLVEQQSLLEVLHGVQHLSDGIGAFSDPRFVDPRRTLAIELEDVRDITELNQLMLSKLGFGGHAIVRQLLYDAAGKRIFIIQGPVPSPLVRKMIRDHSGLDAFIVK